jgi:dTDP-4-amino-4,6-dideoxygalactose transaminase
MFEQNHYITFGAPLISEAEIAAVADVLRSGWLGTGPRTARFESLVGAFVGARHALALNSCTASLHVALLVAGIGVGDEVITTPLTFCATANAVVHSGAKPVFVDVDRETMNIDVAKIEAAVTPRTKAIIPVHMAGRPCDMDRITSLAKKHNLIVIEDAAHALGAYYKGRAVGSISDMTCFSFYVTKNITTGEGGMITTNNPEFADKIKTYSLHGMSRDAWKRYSDDGYKHYDVVYPGYKYNLTDMAAAIGICQMEKIIEYGKRREALWQYYNKAFQDLPLTLPAPASEPDVHARHIYTVLVDEAKTGISRDVFMQALHVRGVGSGVHFNPVHLYSYYQNTYGYRRGDYSNAEYIGDRTVSLPLSAKLTDSEVEKVITVVKDAFQNRIAV